MTHNRPSSLRRRALAFRQVPSRSTSRPIAATCAISPTTPRFVREGGLCINPEAGEIFYLSREEKRRVLEIAMEEAHGKLPIIAGTWALTTEETVETAKDCKALGVNGIFVTPPGGAQDVTSCWDADGYPEIWLDQIIAQDRAVDLPIGTHPVGGAKPPFIRPAARRDIADLPRGQERRRLEDHLHV